MTTTKIERDMLVQYAKYAQMASQVKERVDSLPAPDSPFLRRDHVDELRQINELLSGLIMESIPL